MFYVVILCLGIVCDLMRVFLIYFVICVFSGKRFGDCILRVCLGFCLIEVNIEGRWLLFSISA